jgi:hypothetical protein
MLWPTQDCVLGYFLPSVPDWTRSLSDFCRPYRTGHGRFPISAVRTGLDTDTFRIGGWRAAIAHRGWGQIARRWQKLTGSSALLTRPVLGAAQEGQADEAANF